MFILTWAPDTSPVILQASGLKLDLGTAPPRLSLMGCLNGHGKR